MIRSIITLLLSGLASVAAAQGPLAPIDRAPVAMPPIYAAPPASFLRLPETRSTPVAAVLDRVPSLPGPSPVTEPVAGLSVVTADRPTWSPARLEPVVGIDARGRVTSVLEYTPGRFDR